MNKRTEESADRLLDEIASEIRDMPIPEYPSFRRPAAIDGGRDVSSSGRGPTRTSRSSASVVVGCLLLLSAFVFEIGRLSPQVARVAETVDGLTVRRSPAQTRAIDPTSEWNRMLTRLNRLSEELDELESEVALLEVQAEVTTLLAEYTLEESLNR